MPWALAPGAIGVVVGLVYLREAGAYDAGTAARPGPGMFPLLLGMVFILLSVLAIVTEHRHPSLALQPVGPNTWRVPVILLAMLAYIVMLKPLGFVVAASFLCAITMRILKSRPWPVILTFSVGASLALYFLFTSLDVPVPAGILPF